MRTDRRPDGGTDMTILLIALRNCAKAPEKISKSFRFRYLQLQASKRIKVHQHVCWGPTLIYKILADVLFYNLKELIKIFCANFVIQKLNFPAGDRSVCHWFWINGDSRLATENVMMYKLMIHAAFLTGVGGWIWSISGTMIGRAIFLCQKFAYRSVVLFHRNSKLDAMDLNLGVHPEKARKPKCSSGQTNYLNTLVDSHYGLYQLKMDMCQDIWWKPDGFIILTRASH